MHMQFVHTATSRILILALLCLQSATYAAPPEPPSDVPPSPEELLDSIEALPEEKIERAMEEYREAMERLEEAKYHVDGIDRRQSDVIQDIEQDLIGKKFIEIRIDGDGIFAIDTEGEEYQFSLGAGPEAPLPPPKSGETCTYFGDVYIDYDDELYCNVFVWGGDIMSDGVVEGDIVSSGTVTLGPGAIVTGDIYAPKLQKDPAAEHLGKYSKVRIPMPPGPHLDVGLPGLGTWILVVLYIVAFSMLILLIFQRPVRRIDYQLNHGFLKNFFAGLLIILGLGPMFVLLCITIIGLPVAILIYPFAVAAAVVLGFIGAAYYAGRIVGNRMKQFKFSSNYLTTIVGILAMTALWFASGFFASVGVGSLAGVFFGFGAAVISVFLLAGMGAIWFSKFGVRPKDIDSTDDTAGPEIDGESASEDGAAPSPQEAT